MASALSWQRAGGAPPRPLPALPRRRGAPCQRRPRRSASPRRLRASARRRHAPRPAELCPIPTRRRAPHPPPCRWYNQAVRTHLEASLHMWGAGPQVVVLHPPVEVGGRGRGLGGRGGEERGGEERAGERRGGEGRGREGGGHLGGLCLGCLRGWQPGCPGSAPPMAACPPLFGWHRCACRMCLTRLGCPDSPPRTTHLFPPRRRPPTPCAAALPRQVTAAGGGAGWGAGGAQAPAHHAAGAVLQGAAEQGAPHAAEAAAPSAPLARTCSGSHPSRLFPLRACVCRDLASVPVSSPAPRP